MGVSIYCLSFGLQKKDAMTKRFQAQGLSVVINPGISHYDRRIYGLAPNAHVAKTWSNMYGHLDMIRWFVYHTEDAFGIFCEDDILIHTNFSKMLPALEACMKRQSLDVLALGYLCENPIDGYSNFPTLEEKTDAFPFKILGYPDSLWGTQMYMLSREHAKQLLDLYEHSAADAYGQPFAADWTLTKQGRRALVYPMLAIEDGNAPSEPGGQRDSRIRCFAFASTIGTYS
jgi:hypothetical protein